ncbi:universal stress protein [Nonomuraea coxensis]|uniref:universal stress protein n=1 Tax=Nonomuraea coxensis TaxID=404386 RepID=UPI001C5DDC2F
MKRIIVGFDGSHGTAAALGWALSEARLHHAHLLAWTVLPEQTAAATRPPIRPGDRRAGRLAVLPPRCAAGGRGGRAARR